MTTIVLIGDVHANLPALESVIEDFERTEPDMVFCLGDLVGYAPWPNEVIEDASRGALTDVTERPDERAFRTTLHRPRRR